MRAHVWFAPVVFHRSTGAALRSTTTPRPGYRDFPASATICRAACWTCGRVAKTCPPPCPSPAHEPDPLAGPLAGPLDGQARLRGSDFFDLSEGPAIVKIYTRKGDGGETSLFGGERAPKDDPRFEALGSVDELVASLGLAKAEVGVGPLKEQLTAIQSELYLAMAEIASSAPERGKPPAASLPADATAKLEALIDALDAALPPLKEFVMPGESRASAALHVARTVCRRAERATIVARRTAVIPASAVVYLNRLSDLLFVMARAVDHDAGGKDRTFKSAL